MKGKVEVRCEALEGGAGADEGSKRSAIAHVDCESRELWGDPSEGRDCGWEIGGKPPVEGKGGE